MRGRIGRWALRALAVLALGADGLSTLLHPGPSADHGFLNAIAIIVSGWAIADGYARYIGGRLKNPGNAGDYRDHLEVIAGAAVAHLGEKDDDGGGCAKRTA
jgi:hypothetical protein